MQVKIDQNKKLKKILMFMSVVLIYLAITLNIKAMAASTNFEILNYDVDMNLNENAKMIVSEEITVRFTATSHGIIRNIPTTTTLYREDGIKVPVKSEILSATSTSHKFQKNVFSDGVALRLGDENYTYSSGEIVTFKVNYMYKMLMPTSDSYSEFYYNILGDKWDTTTENLTARIRMPKPFDPSKVGFSVGTYGMSGYASNLTYNVSGNEIDVTCKNIKRREAVTMRVELPAGYFKYDQSDMYDINRLNKLYESTKYPEYEILKYTTKIDVSKKKVAKVNEIFDVKTHYNNNIYENYSLIVKDKSLITPMTYKRRTMDGILKYNNKKYSDIVMLEKSDIALRPVKDSGNVKTYNVQYEYEEKGDKNYFFFPMFREDKYTPINEFNFEVTLPDKVNPNDVKITLGSETVENLSNLNYRVEGNKIFGKTTRTILPKQDLYLKVKVPNGYFNYINIIPSRAIKYMLIILGFGIAIILRLKIRKINKDYVETVEFYPPEGYSPLDCEYVLKDKVTAKSVTYLVVYLASKGYLSIKDDVDDTIITKLKEYDGGRPEEEMFFNDLFKKSNEVKLKSLKTTFYDSIMNAKSKFERKKGSNYELGNFMYLVYAVIGMCLVIVPLSIADSSKLLINFVIGMALVLSYLLPDKLRRTLLFIGLFMFYAAIPLRIFDVIPILVYALILPRLKTKKKSVREMYGKVSGFKNFLKMAEKERIEKLVQDDPAYFYNILPYAAALGVSKEWIKKFEGMAMEPPDWYRTTSENYNTFVLYNLLDNVDSAMSESRMYSIEESSSSFSSGGGDGFSGGGSSGGGFGGGGGSSW